MYLIKKTSAAALAAVMALGSFTLPAAAEEGDPAFDEFLKNEFVEMMESDYLSMHYTLKNPKAYGIEKPEPIVGTAKEEDYEVSLEEAQSSLDRLLAFDYEGLSDVQKHDYDAYKAAIEDAIAMNSMPDYDWWFSPAEGVIDNLLTNFTEFVFREPEDFEDYLAVLSSTPSVLEDALVLTKAQAAKGIFMTDAALDSTLDSIAKFAAKKEDNQLIEIFNESVDAFEGLDDAKKEELKKENRRIVLEEYIPSYRKCGEELEKLRGSRKTQGGLCDLEGGEEYYRALVKRKTSSSRSTEELLKLCEDYLTDTLSDYIDLLYSGTVNEDQITEYQDPMEILHHLNDCLEEYPEIGEVTFQAKYLDPSVANDTILAYYLNPPIDDMEENQIKINGETVGDDANELFMTLAHEGMPGHMYQTNYYLGTNPAELRTQISMIGYTEGWAMYAETHSAKYAGFTKEYAQMMSLDTALNYVLDAAVDLGVNGLGWSEMDVADWLDNLGLNSAIADQLFAFVADQPGTILPYGVGLAQFEEIRSNAERLLGADFDVKEFNTVLLEHGDRTFEAVAADVDEWIRSKGGIAEPDPVPGHPDRSGTMVLSIAAAVLAALALGAFVMARKMRRKDPFTDHEA